MLDPEGHYCSSTDLLSVSNQLIARPQQADSASSTQNSAQSFKISFSDENVQHTVIWGGQG